MWISSLVPVLFVEESPAAPQASGVDTSQWVYWGGFTVFENATTVPVFVSTQKSFSPYVQLALLAWKDQHAKGNRSLNGYY